LVIVKRLELEDAWAWDLLPGFSDPLVMSMWAQPLDELRAVAAYRGDPPLLTEFQSARPDYTAANTEGSVMESVNYRNVTADVVTELHAMGLTVDSYTADTPADWDALAAAGVDWLMSDDVVGYLQRSAG
jgi:glycerophosphoryl diester phosphodiesterase